MTLSSHAQFGDNLSDKFDQDELAIGGDIFNDFNEDLESDKVLEDERFYQYGRFFAINLGFGLTEFTGNRGAAYDNSPPTLNLSVMAFSNFRVAYLLGIAFSKHSMFFASPTAGSSIIGGLVNNAFGLIEVNMLRFYTGFRYYIDTADLGTALTYSNPYFTMRMEYWYVTNKFLDQPTLDDDSGGGIGGSFGGGLEFPIELRESYVNFEFLVHTVNFEDRLTNDYQPVNGGNGFSDLEGLGLTYMLNYVMAW